jgi:hypothetical protein
MTATAILRIKSSERRRDAPPKNRNMKTLDQHIEDNDAWDRDGQGRECFACHGTYGISEGHEDVGVCSNCAHLMVRDALRYRWLREGRKGTYNEVLIYTHGTLDAMIDERIDAELPVGNSSEAK